MESKSSNCMNSIEQESRWDTRAHDFNHNQLSKEQKLPKEIIDYILIRCPEITSVLDVGGGAGRYALLFAGNIEDVLMTDISNNMLGYAKENADKHGLDNIRFIKADWGHDNETDQIKGKFDLVFASMCPAVREKEGVNKMMRFSNKYCAINQFVLSDDSLTTFINSYLGHETEDTDVKKEKRYDPHNDRSMVKDTFIYLWEKGYTPEIRIFSEKREVIMSLEEAKQKYANIPKYKEVNTDLLNKAIESYAADDICTIQNKNVTALLLWEIGGN